MVVVCFGKAPMCHNIWVSIVTAPLASLAFHHEIRFFKFFGPDNQAGCLVLHAGILRDNSFGKK